MAVNKVVINGTDGEQTLIDLTGDDISTDKAFKGVKFHGADGSTKTGTFTLETEMSEQESLIAQIQSALAGKTAGSGVTLPSLTNPATAENLEEGYELIDGNGNIVVGTHVCESGSGGGDYATIEVSNRFDFPIFVCGSSINPEETVTTPIMDETLLISCAFMDYLGLGEEWNYTSIKVVSRTYEPEVAEWVECEEEVPCAFSVDTQLVFFAIKSTYGIYNGSSFEIGYL